MQEINKKKLPFEFENFKRIKLKIKQLNFVK